MPKNIDEINLEKILNFSGPKPTIREPSVEKEGKGLQPEARNLDVHYDLPMPSIEFVNRVNELAPDDSELEFLED